MDHFWLWKQFVSFQKALMLLLLLFLRIRFSEFSLHGSMVNVAWTWSLLREEAKEGNSISTTKHDSGCYDALNISYFHVIASCLCPTAPIISVHYLVGRGKESRQFGMKQIYEVSDQVCSQIWQEQSGLVKLGVKKQQSIDNSSIGPTNTVKEIELIWFPN